MMRRPRTTFLWISVVVAATVVSEVENKPHQYNNAYNNQSGMAYNHPLQQLGANLMPTIGIGGVPQVVVNGMPVAGQYTTIHSGTPVLTNPTLIGQMPMMGTHLVIPPGFTSNMVHGNASVAHVQNLSHAFVPNVSAFPAPQYGPPPPFYSNGMPRLPM